jgi:hypothetical protein
MKDRKKEERRRNTRHTPATGLLWTIRSSAKFAHPISSDPKNVLLVFLILVVVLDVRGRVLRH